MEQLPNRSLARAGLLVWLVVVAVSLMMVKLQASAPPTAKFCTADGWAGPNGQLYGRDVRQGCRFVDEDGNVIPGQQ